jgi:hypothetical protein
MTHRYEYVKSYNLWAYEIGGVFLPCSSECLSSHFLSKIVKTETYKVIILLVKAKVKVKLRL